MTKVAVMQPYAFPYIGYFQLINKVNRLVLLDDVNYIKKGWINRNRLLGPQLFTIPLSKPSQNKLIRDTKLHPTYDQWKEKFLKTLTHTYKKAPYFERVFKMLERCLDRHTGNISTLCYTTLDRITYYLEINKTGNECPTICPTSTLYPTEGLKGENRILRLCEHLGATEYYNLSGGKALYSAENFAKRGIKLKFISSKPIAYKQFKEPHQPWLSIIDVMMFNDVDTIKNMLTQVNIEEG